MTIKPVSNEPNFTGVVVLKNKISAQQRHLFDLHKPALDAKIKDMPFDLFVEQSKNKNIITLSTNVKDAESFFVRKNNQNFEEVADFVIADAKKKSDAYKKLVKVSEMFDCQKMSMINIVTGNFKEARESEKKLAKLAVKDFDTYKEIPQLKITEMPFELGKQIMKQSLKYRMYKMFSPKTEDEKQFLQMKKDYIKELKAQNKSPKIQEIKFSQFYQ